MALHKLSVQSVDLRDASSHYVQGASKQNIPIIATDHIINIEPFISAYISINYHLSPSDVMDSSLSTANLSRKFQKPRQQSDLLQFLSQLLAAAFASKNFKPNIDEKDNLYHLDCLSLLPSQFETIIFLNPRIIRFDCW